jgi:hypothetical protein
MDWVKILITLGINSLGQLFLIAAIGLWGRKLIEFFFKETIEIKKTELAQELQLHKQKIEQENTLYKLDIDKNLEEYRNKLEILKLEYQVQFSRLHEKRSEVIETIYQKLVRLNFAILDLTIGHMVVEDAESEEQNRLKEANDSYFEFLKFYSEKKIYFQPEICLILEKLKILYWEGALDLTEPKRMRAMGVTGPDLTISHEKVIAARKSVTEEIPKVLGLLEYEFRILLGVTAIKQS